MEPALSENTVVYQLSRGEARSQLFKMIFRPPSVVAQCALFLIGVGGLTLLQERPMWAWAVLLSPFLFLYFYRRAVKKIIEQHPELLEPQTFSFDQTGVTFTNSMARVSWPWTRIRGVTQTGDYYILRVNTLGSGCVIPLRAFSPEQRERLQSFMKAVAA